MKRQCMVPLLGSLLLFGLAPIATADTIDFDSVSTAGSPYAVSGAPVTDYLQQYGITLVNNTPGTTIYIMCANASYNSSCASGTGALAASTSPNVLYQAGSNSGESFTLDFSSPLSTLSFDLAGFHNAVVPQWSATAYDAGNNVLSSVGQGLASYYSEPPQSFTLNGPGITSVTFYGNGYNFAAFGGPPIDDLSSPDLHAQPVPEPASLVLVGTGFLGVAEMLRRRRQRA